MIELRRVLLEYLLTLHPRVFYVDAATKQPDAELPYVTFSFQPSARPDESKELRMIDVDLWDIPGDNDTTRIETLGETIKGDGNLRSAPPTGLDEQVLENDKIIVVSRFETDQYVKDQNETVKHILQNYQIATFEKEAL